MGNEVSGTTTVYSVEDLLAAEEDEDADQGDDKDTDKDKDKDKQDTPKKPGNDAGKDGKGDKGSADKSSSTVSGGIIAGSVIGVIAALAATIGVLRVPGVRETVLSLAPAPLRAQLEKFL